MTINLNLFLYSTWLLLFASFGGLQVDIAYAQSTSGEQRPDQVWNLEIEGNHAFSDILIKEQIASDGFSFWDKLKFWNRSGHKLDEIEVKKDVIRIRNFYNRRGFPNVQVRYRIEDGSKAWKKNLIFTINEKAAIRIIDISFNFGEYQQYRKMVMNDPEFADHRRGSEYKENKRYEPIKQAEVTSSYRQMLENMGFAYAEVNITANVDTTHRTADLQFNFATGPLTYFENIAVEGNTTVDDQYVIRESGLERGEKYSVDAIQQAQREIFNHHLFRFATIDISEQERDSTLNLQMRVRERKLRSVQASAGFGTEEYLRGQLSWTHRNAFGHAHRFTSMVKASFIEQSVNLDYFFPYVFNTKSSFVISPFAHHLLEESYELSRVGITNSLIYQYSRNLTGSVSYQFTRNTEVARQFNEELPDTTQNYDLSSIQLSAYYNQGYGLRGRQGWIVQPYIEISGFLGSSTFQFQKLSLDVRRYIPLTESTTLAVRAQGGKIFAAKEDSLPNNTRYYLGGTNSIRGWGRNSLGPKKVLTDSVKNEQGNTIPDSTRFSEYIPVGGRTFFGFNIEIRQGIDALFDGFGIAIFLDGGQVWRKEMDLAVRPLQFGVGGGIRYESPIGPVRLDIAYKVNPSDQDLNMYRGRDYGNALDRIGIHISVGQSF